MKVVTGAESQTAIAGPTQAAPHALTARATSRLSAWKRRQLAGWLFLTPAILYLLFAFALPIIYNVMLSFEQTSPATIADLTAPFAGFANYRFILDDPTTRTAIVHTFEFTAGSLFGQFMIGFSLALLFSLRFPCRTLARSFVIVPWLLPLIVTGVIFKFMFQLEGGAVNQLLMDVGLVHHSIDWLDDPHLALWTVLIANIWLGVPFFTLLLYSALQDVPVEVKEAALMDGAGPWQRLRLIIVPIILPVIEITLLLGFVFTVKVFDLVIALTGGGPANATQLITTWSYNLSFQEFSFGEGAALNNVLLVLAMFCRAVVPVAQPGFLEAQLGSREMTRLQRSRALRWLCTLAAVGALVPVLFPVYAVIVGSFESTETLFSGTYYWLPHAPTLDNFRTVIQAQSGNVLTSLIVGVGTALLALVVAVPAAYALSKYRLRVTLFIVSSLLVAQIVPSIVLATSLFIIFHWIHLVNTYPGLIIADGTYAIPFAILVLRAFFFSLPNEVLQASRVDGASEWQTFQRIVVPLARSAVITVAVFAFLNGWGDFIFALTILNGATIVPITLGIYTYLGNYSTDWGAVMASAAFAMVPAAVMLVVAQRYIASGLTAGSVVG